MMNNYLLMKFPKKIKLFNIFILVLLTSQFLIHNKSKVYATLKTDIKAQINKDKKVLRDNLQSTYPTKDYLKNIDKNKFYILGPGDIFNLQLNELSIVNDLPTLGGDFTIDLEGFVSLPRLKRVKVAGLTVEELTKLLNLEYSNYLKNVDTRINIISYRSAKIYLDGEIANPGLHVLSSKTDSIKNISLFNNINPTPTGGSTLFDALRLAGGVSLKSDLTNIEITRINSLSNGGGRIKTNINLFKALDLSDTSQNINLRDGDTVFVPTLSSKDSPAFNKILKSNINPRFINIYISGRVKEPGIKQLFNASTLIDGINIAGGAKIIKGKVRFLRYNNDGTIDKRIFNLKPNAKRGSYKNPYLNNGDIIFIGDSLLSVTSEVLNEITDPFKSILSTYSFFKIINE